MINLKILGMLGALLLICWVMVPVMFLSPGSAMAAGGSAADNQYQDPLAGATNTAPLTATTPAANSTKTTADTGATSAAGRASNGAVTSTTSTAATLSRSTPTAVKTAPSTLSPTAPSSIDGDPNASESLPMTGLNVGAVALVGAALLAGGLALRWRSTRLTR